MTFVARFQTHIHHGALKPSEFGARVGHHVDFLNGISRQEREFVGAGARADQGPGVHKYVDVLHSIEHPIVALDAGAVG